jgi:membrane protease YdiL (CAAX protease family)
MMDITKKPILTGLVLISITLFFRLLDIFLFKLDELLGEIILSKVVGFIIVVLFLKLIGKSLRDIGYSKQNLVTVFVIGGLLTTIIIVMSYLFELAIFNSHSPEIVFKAIDPKAGIAGEYLFGSLLIAGNVINCFMEESLFRGVLIPLFGEKYKIRTAISLQALLFGAWHLPWAFKWYLSGVVSTPLEFTGALITNFIPQFLMGIVFGMMFYYTRTIWTPWIAHFLINTAVNLVHTSYADGLNQGIVARMGFLLVVFLLSIPVIRRYSSGK